MKLIPMTAGTASNAAPAGWQRSMQAARQMLEA